MEKTVKTEERDGNIFVITVSCSGSMNWLDFACLANVEYEKLPLPSNPKEWAIITILDLSGITEVPSPPSQNFAEVTLASALSLYASSPQCPFVIISPAENPISETLFSSGSYLLEELEFNPAVCLVHEVKDVAPERILESIAEQKTSGEFIALVRRIKRTEPERRRILGPRLTRESDPNPISLQALADLEDHKEP